MDFHQYRLMKDWAGIPGSDKMPVREFYYQLYRNLENGWEPSSEYAPMLLGEMSYVKCYRPFYHVYPQVEQCLENTRLDLTLRQIGHLDAATAACFAVGREPKISNGRVAAMIIEVCRDAVDLRNNCMSGEPLMRLVVDRIRQDGQRCFSCIQYSGNESLEQLDIGDKKKLVSLAVGIVMLAKDERFAEPILLSRDRNKKFKSEEDVGKAIERAKRRGRNGLAIGKGLSFSPHVRRPHFGIRWTGKGRLVPKLTPIRGCVVSRDKLFPIPTGHEDSAPSKQD